MNGNIRVQDVKADNMEILNSPRISVASVVLTRQLKQEEATAPAATTAATAAPALQNLQQKLQQKRKKRKNNFSIY